MGRGHRGGSSRDKVLAVGQQEGGEGRPAQPPLHLALPGLLGGRPCGDPTQQGGHTAWGSTLDLPGSWRDCREQCRGDLERELAAQRGGGAGGVQAGGQVGCRPGA